MVLKEIEERYSVRNFLDKEIPKEILREILEAGRLAPSWMNSQSWHFLVVRSPQNKALISQLALGQPHVEKASAIIVCCGDKDAWEKPNFRKILEANPRFTEERINMVLSTESLYPALRGDEILTMRTMEGLTYAVAYMTLEAQRHGVGVCIIGVVANNLTGSAPEVHQLARKTFNLPENVEIMNLLLLGFPDETAPKPVKLRKSFDEVVSFESYGE